jgi:FtsZ-binding cell division protein ZapB
MSALKQRSATLKRAGNTSHLIRKRSAHSRHFVRPISLMTTLPQDDLFVIQVHREEGPFQFLLLDTTTVSVRVITSQGRLSTQMNRLTEEVNRLSTEVRDLRAANETLTTSNNQLKKDVENLTTELTVSNAALVKKVDTFLGTFIETLTQARQEINTLTKTKR